MKSKFDGAKFAEEMAEWSRDRMIKDQYIIQKKILDEEVSKLRKYLVGIEELTGKAEQKELSRVGLEQPKDLEDEYFASLYSQDWDAVFHQNFRQSFVIHAVGFLEYLMIAICRDVESLAELPLTVSELNGSTISKIEKYLTKLAGFNGPPKTTWDKLKNIYIIRNAIIHSYGVVDQVPNQEKLENVIKQLPGIEIDSNPNFDSVMAVGIYELIYVDVAFCKYIIDLIDELITVLCNEMAAVCKRIS